MKYKLLIFQLAGVVAVEVTGGPTIDFVPGRKVHKNDILKLLTAVLVFSFVSGSLPKIHR